MDLEVAASAFSQSLIVVAVDGRAEKNNATAIVNNNNLFIQMEIAGRMGAVNHIAVRPADLLVGLD